MNSQAFSGYQDRKPSENRNLQYSAKQLQRYLNKENETYQDQISKTEQSQNSIQQQYQSDDIDLDLYSNNVSPPMVTKHRSHSNNVMKNTIHNHNYSQNSDQQSPSPITPYREKPKGRPQQHQTLQQQSIYQPQNDKETHSSNIQITDQKQDSIEIQYPYQSHAMNSVQVKPQLIPAQEQFMKQSQQGVIQQDQIINAFEMNKLPIIIGKILIFFGNFLAMCDNVRYTVWPVAGFTVAIHHIFIMGACILIILNQFPINRYNQYFNAHLSAFNGFLFNFILDFFFIASFPYSFTTTGSAWIAGSCFMLFSIPCIICELVFFIMISVKSAKKLMVIKRSFERDGTDADSGLYVQYQSGQKKQKVKKAKEPKVKQPKVRQSKEKIERTINDGEDQYSYQQNQYNINENQQKLYRQQQPDIPAESMQVTGTYKSLDYTMGPQEQAKSIGYNQMKQKQVKNSQYSATRQSINSQQEDNLHYQLDDSLDVL